MCSLDTFRSSRNLVFRESLPLASSFIAVGIWEMIEENNSNLSGFIAPTRIVTVASILRRFRLALFLSWHVLRNKCQLFMSHYVTSATDERQSTKHRHRTRDWLFKFLIHSAFDADYSWIILSIDSHVVYCAHDDRCHESAEPSLSASGRHVAKYTWSMVPWSKISKYTSS